MLLQLFAGTGGGERISGHPFYVGVVEINYNAKESELEISCKVFTNDFETALEKSFQQKFDLSDPKGKPAADKAIADYVIRHLQLRVDDKPLTLQYLGSENEAEATWSYFQAANIHSVKSITVTNNILYDTFEAQINIVHVLVNGVRKSTKLTNPESQAQFRF